MGHIHELFVLYADGSWYASGMAVEEFEPRSNPFQNNLLGP